MTADRRPVRQRLAEFYTPVEAEAWLHRPHPQLDGITPWQATACGLSGEVHALIDRLDEGAYL